MYKCLFAVNVALLCAFTSLSILLQADHPFQQYIHPNNRLSLTLSLHSPAHYGIIRNSKSFSICIQSSWLKSSCTRKRQNQRSICVILLKYISKMHSFVCGRFPLGAGLSKSRDTSKCSFSNRIVNVLS